MDDETAAKSRPQVRLPSGPVGRLLASIGNLSNSLTTVHSRYAQDHGLGLRAIWTLSAISEGHVSPGAIARLMILPPSVVSGDLNGLIERGLISRFRDASDGRRLVYSLTDAGRDVLADAHAVYVGLLGDKLASFPAEQLEQMLRLLYEISLHVRAHVEAQPAVTRD